jgi:hypothetical protein
MEPGTRVKDKVEFCVKPNYPGQASIEVVAGRPEVLKHLIASRIQVFESHNQHTVLRELFGSMNCISTPFVIGNMVKHMTE